MAGASELGSVVEERQRVCEAPLLRPTSWKVPSRVPLGSPALCVCPGKSPGVPAHVCLLFQGRIACANVLSDLYAMGVTECDNMLMLLGVSNKMTDRERDKVMPLIIQGFKDAAEEAGTSVTGGQTVLNPWIVLGGVATTVCQPNEFIM